MSANDQDKSIDNKVHDDLQGDDLHDAEYVSSTGEQEPIPVQSDKALVEDPIDENTADSEEQLGTVD
jgi:hypothetical protein